MDTQLDTLGTTVNRITLNIVDVSDNETIIAA